MGRWLLNLLCYAPDDGGGGGGGGENKPPADPPKPPDPNADPPKDPPAPRGLTLTAEQIAAIQAGQPLVLNDDQFRGGVQQRLNQYAAEKRALEAKVKEAEDRETADKKAKLEADGKLQELLDLERAERAKLESQVSELGLQGAFRAAAATANIVDFEAALLLAKASPGWAEVKAENGAVVGLEAVIAQLVKDRPYLVSSQSKPPVGGPSNPDPKTPDKEPPKDFEEARKRMQALT